jgi:hypothetical protein
MEIGRDKRSTMQITIYVAIGMLFTLARPLHAHESESECEKIKLKIAKIESRMRQPYTAVAGVRMEERLRVLRRKRKEHCG